MLVERSATTQTNWPRTGVSAPLDRTVVRAGEVAPAGSPDPGQGAGSGPEQAPLVQNGVGSFGKAGFEPDSRSPFGVGGGPFAGGGGNPDSSNPPVSRRGQGGSALGRAYDHHAMNGALPVGRLDNREQRLEALRQITQLDNLSATPNPSDNNRCGAASIVGGVLLAGGYQGLQELISDLRGANPAQGQPGHQDLSALDAILPRLANGSATQEDIARIQDGLYQVLSAKEADSNPYLRNVSVADFIMNSPHVGEMFRQEGLNIRNIDGGDADDAGNHFVLGFNGGIYDPWPRSQGQIATSLADVGTYQLATDQFVFPLQLRSNGGETIHISRLWRDSQGQMNFSGSGSSGPVSGHYNPDGSWVFD